MNQSLGDPLGRSGCRGRGAEAEAIMRKWLRRIRGTLGMGVTFSGLLVLTEGRRRLDQLSLPRVAGWGAIGGVLLSALFVRGASLGWGEMLAISTTFALASAVSASGSLVLAGRAVRRELPDSPGDTAEAERLLGGGT